MASSRVAISSYTSADNVRHRLIRVQGPGWHLCPLYGYRRVVRENGGNSRAGIA